MSEIEPLIEETIEVDAPAARVWALVTDLPRMASWSPQVVRSFVRGGEGIRLGTRLVNINRHGLKVWPTRSKVIRFEPHREFAFRIRDNGSIWSFTLEPTATGTRVVQRREAPDGLTDISQQLTQRFLGGQQSFQAGLRDGMRQTLQRIKVDAEAA